MKVGILTGGGDAPGLNAVIRAATKAAIIEKGWEIVGIRDGFAGLIDINRTKPLTLSSVRGLLPKGGTILGTTNRGNPFNFPVMENGKTVLKDLSDEVLKNIQKLNLAALIVIGGDGSLKIARDFSKKGLNVIGIPKTIDNDISATDVTFGFNTAVTTAMEAIDKLHTTAESHHRVMILEVMGRYAGWIALEAGIAGGSDVILIPEIPFEFDSIFHKVEQRNSGNIKFSVLVVAEGARPKNGEMFFQDEKSFGREKRLGGVGDYVSQVISEKLEMESRVTVLGHLQRGGSPSAYDRILGTWFGAAAIDLVANGDFGKMVCLHGKKVSSVDIEKAVGKMKKVKIKGQLVKTAEYLGICLGR